MTTKAMEKKKKVIDSIKEKMESASIIVLADFRKTTGPELTALRKKLYKKDSEYKVVKNSLLSRAIDSLGFEGLKEHLSGPTAVLLGYKDPVDPLKDLVEFIKDSEKGQIKIGVMDKAVVDAKQIEAISKLPGKDVLLARVVGGLQAPIYGFVNVLQGTLRKFVYALSAVKDKKAQEAPKEQPKAVEEAKPEPEVKEEVKKPEESGEKKGGE